MADGKTGVAELGLGKEGEEVGLVLVFIFALEEGERAVGERTTLRIVAGGDRGETVLAGPGAEYAELDLAVAHDVGVGREAAGIAVEQVGDDPVAIVLHEIDHAELDAEMVADGAGVIDVLLPGTMADDVVLVDPVFHVRADDGHALPLEDEGGDRAVDAAGHGDEGFFGSGHEGGGNEGRERLRKTGDVNADVPEVESSLSTPPRLKGRGYAQPGRREGKRKLEVGERAKILRFRLPDGRGCGALVRGGGRLAGACRYWRVSWAFCSGESGAVVSQVRAAVASCRSQ
jgi:hypothetical protein